MSLVGTRPILQDELLKYELHHRARIAIKPYDMSRIMGQPVESKNETTATQSALQQPTSQEGK